MPGKRQLPQETYDAVAEMYVANVPLDKITGKFQIARGTLYTILRAKGIPKKGRWRDGPVPPPMPEVPKRERDHFDKKRVIPFTPCQCGTGCGLSFQRTNTQRSRRFAEGCPGYAARRLAQQTAASAAQKDALRGDKPKRGRGGQPGVKRGPYKGAGGKGYERRPIRWCDDCGGLAHRRPEDGSACSCGERYAPDTILAHERFVIQRSGLEL